MPLSSRTFSQLIDFTRTSAATFVNSSGNIASTPQSRNLLTFTQEFTNAAWTKTNSTVIPNVNPAAASLGAELVTNGDFAGGTTGWTDITGAWAVSSGALAGTSVSANAFGPYSNNTNVVAGRVYAATFTLTVSAGGLRARVGNAESALISAAGTYTLYLVAETSGVTVFQLRAGGSGFTGSIDNISVREVVGGWNVAPDGTSTADTLLDTAVSNIHYAYQAATPAIAANTSYTVSVFAKASTLGFVTVGVSDISSGSLYAVAVFNLSNGTLATSGAAGTGYAVSGTAITSVGNGWYRCAVTVTTGSSVAFARAIVGINKTGVISATAGGLESYLGNGSGILIWGAQLEQASAATDYTRNFGGLFPPRFDYDPVTRAPRGLLIEEQRTNFYTYSSDFTNAAWTKNLLNLTAGADIGPDGTTSATLIAANAGGNANIYGNYTGTGVQYTGSIWIKAGTSSTANINLFQNGIGVVPMTMTIISGPGTIGAVSSSNGPITGLSSTQWTRVAVTSTGALTGNVNFYVKPNSGSVSSLGDSVYIWGAQLEAGAFATSYIPTVASQVTRSADVAAINAPNFASWYNQSEGTIVAEYSRYQNVDFGVVAELKPTSTNTSDRFCLQATSAADPRAQLFPNGSAALDSTSTFGVLAANTTVKAALAYRSGDSAATRNGASPFTSATTFSTPSYTNLQIGSSNNDIYGSAATNPLNGHIRSIRFYPTRLTNAQLQALTA